jgi:integrase
MTSMVTEGAPTTRPLAVNDEDTRGQLELATIDAEGQRLDRKSRADRTWRGHQQDWPHFVGWRDDRGLMSLPAEASTVARYLTVAAALFKVSALVVKAGAERIGLDPQDFSGHSLRAGFVTSAADGGATEHAIMNQTGHRSSEQVRVYMRDGRLFHNNAAAVTGL